MTSIWTADADGEVKLRMTETGPGAEEPLTILDVFKDTLERTPDREALKVKRKGTWQTWTYQQYYDDVRTAAKAMIKLGLQPYHGVGILGFNSPEWFIADLGAIFALGFAAGIYTTNNPEACAFVAADCEANIIVAEDDKQLQKILQVRKELPHLRAIIQYSGTPVKADDVYSWDQFMEIGRQQNDEELERRMAQLKPNKCCTLIYTSGTTGNPKGVMISHDNVTWTANRVASMAQLEDDEHVVSYLPLSHIAAQMLDIHTPLMYGATVWFAQPDALKGTLVETLKEARPTVFLGVPRVWEKIAEKMQAVGRSVTGVKKSIATWAKSVGLRGNYALQEGGSVPWGWTAANWIVFYNIRKALGLDRCRLQLTGAAPISKETLEYFLSINIPLYELYGMSESCGPQTVSLPTAYRTGSCGRTFLGAETKIDSPGPDGAGEILFKGRHIFMGYLRQPGKTKEAIDGDGWLHSGDVGRVDKDGYLFITGRIKELLITAGGENIPPVIIEDTIKEELPFLSNVMVIGDKRKFLTCLVTLKVEQDSEGNPTDKLTSMAIADLQKAGSNATTATEAAADKAVFKAIEAGIIRANKRAVSRAQNIQKFKIIPRDFSVAGGELGPTLKLKRHTVVQLYASDIEALYADAGAE